MKKKSLGVDNSRLGAGTDKEEISGDSGKCVAGSSGSTRQDPYIGNWEKKKASLCPFKVENLD